MFIYIYIRFSTGKKCCPVRPLVAIVSRGRWVRGPKIILSKAFSLALLQLFLLKNMWVFEML